MARLWGSWSGQHSWWTWGAPHWWPRMEGVASGGCLLPAPSGDPQGQTAGGHVFRDRSCQGPPHCPWDGVLHPHGMVYSSRTVPKGPGVTEAVWMNPHATLSPSAPAALSPPVHRGHPTGCSPVGIPTSHPVRTPPQRTTPLPAPSRSAFHSHLQLCPGNRQHSKQKPHQEPTVPAEESWSPHQVCPEHGFALNQHALMSLPWHQTSMLKQLYLEVTQEREDKCTISNECGNRCKIIKSRKLKANVTQNKQIKETGLEAFRKQKKKKEKWVTFRVQ